MKRGEVPTVYTPYENQDLIRNENTFGDDTQSTVVLCVRSCFIYIYSIICDVIFDLLF